MSLYLFTCEPIYSGESPIFAIECIPTIAYEVTFPSVAGNRRVVTMDKLKGIVVCLIYLASLHDKNQNTN